MRSDTAPRTFATLDELINSYVYGSAVVVACFVVGPHTRPSFWAVFVGTAILLFFALIALANSLLPVALVGFALCAARLLLLTKFRPG